MTEKSREQKLRRDALRNGLRAQKGKASVDETGWMIIDENTNAVIAGNNPVPYTLSLEEAEEYVKAFKR